MSVTCSVPLHLVYCQRHCFELGWSMWSLVTKLLRDSSLYGCGTFCINLFIDRHLGYEKFYLLWIPQGHKQISLWWIAKWVVSFTFFFSMNILRFFWLTSRRIISFVIKDMFLFNFVKCGQILKDVISIYSSTRKHVMQYEYNKNTCLVLSFFNLKTM